MDQNFLEQPENAAHAILRILEQTAEGPRQPVITYSELTGQCAYEMNTGNVDFSDPGQRSEFSNILGDVADMSFRKYGFLITSIVVYSGDQIGSNGFRTAMVRNKLLKSSANDDDVQKALFDQMNAVWAHFDQWAGGRKPRK